MKIEQIYTGCLAQGAYYIESAGEVAIIDPLRETRDYIEKAKQDGAKIKYIFETHFHADFVSGHVDLAEKTGAQIVFGPGAKTTYNIIEATENQLFELGNIKIKVLHTPGHTLESTSYLLIDENGINHALFSGDTLFIGDVGRPDLAVKSDLTKEDLAGQLFDSLRNKIMPLGDKVIVYPAHGAGSSCGKNMSAETFDTLGNQKKVNYALRADMTKAEFIKEVTDGILPPPQYFAKNVSLNKTGYQNFDSILNKGTIALDLETFEAMANHEGALVLDTRTPEEFATAHIPNSIFIGIDGGFAPWVGALIKDISQRIIFVAESGREVEVVTRLSRVGYDNSLGYLKGGFESWGNAGKEVETVNCITTKELGATFDINQKTIIDVRRPGEYMLDHIENALSLPLDYINENMDKLNPDSEYLIHCAGGYRSIIFASILKSRGIHHVTDINGGFNEIVKTNVPRTGYVAASH
jgi:glyoxylase-like metal-dependent hydrolase (beta-lactamase superfamily II)/rhodanese-related sulfurtransferase